MNNQQLLRSSCYLVLPLPVAAELVFPWQKQIQLAALVKESGKKRKNLVSLLQELSWLTAAAALSTELAEPCRGST